jgi:4-hydroxy-tetrahydrodipicolinate reductase
MKGTRRVRLCIVGAAGRMGSSILAEARKGQFEVTGAVSSSRDPRVGKTLRALGLSESDVELQPPSSLADLLGSSDVCISFTNAEAELANLQAYRSAGKPMVIGTTGFSSVQRTKLETALRDRIPSVITANFAIGANMLFALSSAIGKLPREFDISLLEIHHSGKSDAPSGTAKTIAEIISKERGYSRIVHGRSGISKRSKEELEVSSFRGGGMPGDHVIYAIGPHEMLKLEHLAFSRSPFSQGALLAAEWLSAGRKPGIYGMLDVLNLQEKT